ncbi:metalloregulator ArsR/SmtB family transcription factor [Halomonas campisalis]|uniref:metalloregulator ArsR/SmtB family transcription factor n=1 Tax=Billgrantia campisalis TaxID=74661 RepID=UPI001EEFFD15|nr:metalloregulator ArsR/SmtB family transcription factor [Halomonas campisalis]MDR5864737.1 metalloregulator ArsR/SmtB family transcription factor [Halomonas campisalis]
MEPARFFKCLGDETRLTLILLIQREEELCVCEMTHTLEESQPKVSRHLAQLRTCGLLSDRRDGQWVYYRLSDELPEWVLEVLVAADKGQDERLSELQQRLSCMGNRPERRLAMC